MSKQCPRLWEVEAVRDGRLVDAERARVESHLTHCADCAREANSLDKLGSALRERSSVIPDELSIRRRRQTLLQAANASLQESPSRPKQWFVVMGTLAAVAALVFLGTRALPSHNESQTPLAVASTVNSPIDIRGDDHSVFLRASEGAIDRVVISHGRVTFTIRRHDDQRRLLVQTPDAEIEDIGTIFSVLVEDGKTTEVQVLEGSVRVRLRGTPATVIEAGFTWRPPIHAESSAKPFVESAPLLPTASVHSTGQHASARPHASAPLPETAHSETKSASIEPAMVAYRGGDYKRAAALFEQFEREAPNDARAEDASYFRVLALLRAGQSTAAQAAARDYLVKYPDGFRTREVERIANP